MRLVQTAALVVLLAATSRWRRQSSSQPGRATAVLASLSVLLLPAVGLLYWSGTATPPAVAQALPPPNIILIVLDDLDLAPVAQMPQLQSLLVDQGITFTNAFVTQSLCCPSRASILRGQYPHNHKVQANLLPDGGFKRFRDLGQENSTIATWLHSAGYRTALIGKYLNGYTKADIAYVPPGWDEWYATVGPAYFNYSMSHNGVSVYYGTAPQDYATDVLAELTVDFIQRSAGSAPFFIYLVPNAPHGFNSGAPPVPAPRHQGMFAGAQVPRVPSFNEADVSDKPPWIKKLAPLTQAQISSRDTHYQARLATMQAVDDLIAAVIQALADTGELDNTYIFFSSDNGFHLGHHRLLAGKEHPYEEDIRVPLIARGPGLPAGETRPHLALNMDLAPTVAALAGLTPPSFVDGRSLAPLLSATPPPVEEWRQAFLVERWPDSLVAVGAARIYQAMRAHDLVYVEYWAQRELYDLSVDPYQVNNFYSSAPPALITQLVAQLDAFRDCAGAGCRAAEGVVSAPDLVESSVGNPPASAAQGASFGATDTATNQGTLAAAASTTRYYLSLDTQRSSGDSRLTGSRAVPSLSVGTTAGGTVTVTIPTNVPTGSYFLLACADDTGVVAERTESNNCRASAGKIAVIADGDN